MADFKQRAHITRIFGTNKNEDVLSDMWVDVERIHNVTINMPTPETTHQIKSVYISWNDDPENEDYEPETDGKVVRKICRPDETDFEEPEEWVPVKVISQIKFNDSGKTQQHTFLIAEEASPDKRRILHYDTNIDNDAQSAFNDNGRKAYVVARDDYEADRETKDEGQYVEQQIVNSYKVRFNNYEQNNGRDQEAKVYLRNRHPLIDDEGDPAPDAKLEELGPDDVNPPYLLDPYQAIINVNLGAAVEFNDPVNMYSSKGLANTKQITIAMVVRVPQSLERGGIVMDFGPVPYKRKMGPAEDVSTYSHVSIDVSLEDPDSGSISFVFGGEPMEGEFGDYCGVAWPLCHPRQKGGLEGGAFCHNPGDPIFDEEGSTATMNLIVISGPIWEPLGGYYFTKEIAVWSDDAFKYNGLNGTVDRPYHMSITGACEHFTPGAWHLVQFSADTETNKITIALDNVDRTLDRNENGDRINADHSVGSSGYPLSFYDYDLDELCSEPGLLNTPEDYPVGEGLDPYGVTWPTGWKIELDDEPVSIPISPEMREEEDYRYQNPPIKVEYGPVMIWTDEAADWSDQELRELFCKTRENSKGETETVLAIQLQKIIDEFGEPDFYFTGGKNKFPINRGTEGKDDAATVQDGEIDSFSPAPTVLGKVIKDKNT